MCLWALLLTPVVCLASCRLHADIAALILEAWEVGVLMIHLFRDNRVRNQTLRVCKQATVTVRL